ncbi:TIGR00341 family protein [Candidatus Nanohalobium constans]|uniref:TIGR00341 family protein n=1 Tax=Candidatus Nanohalobium constans TaxID=2565781 RepID=UPI001C3C2AA3|nr:TIGR00341 family protein [Candidatus Nanohalobium constans]
MRQLQVTVPKKFSEEAKEILEDFSTDISTKEAEKDDYKAVEVTATAESDDIDEITAKLKDIGDIESGKLSIRVLEQESLIQKGQKTKGSFSALSQEEIYSKAQESGSFNITQWSLVAASSAIAALGIASNSIIAVIGAMMLAPMLSPFIAGSISLSVGDRTLMQDSMIAGFGSILLAFITALLISLPLEFTVTSALSTVLAPGFLAVPLSLIVGAAAALSFTTGFRDQIAGVAVAVALVPPIAAAGLTFGAGRYLLGFKALNLAIMNVLAVLVSGYACLKVFGLEPTTYYKKKSAETMRKAIPIGIILIMLLGIPLSFSFYDTGGDIGVQDSAEDFFGDNLVKVQRGNDEVTVMAYGNFSTSSFESRFEDRNVDVVILERK